MAEYGRSLVSRLQALETADATMVDAAALAEIEQLMGQAWVEAALRELASRLAEAFDAPDEARLDPHRLARRVHRLVSLAALLGFAGLSSACRRLEDACVDGKPLGESYAQALIHADGARRVLTRLVAGRDQAPKLGD